MEKIDESGAGINGITLHNPLSLPESNKEEESFVREVLLPMKGLFQSVGGGERVARQTSFTLGNAMKGGR